MRKIVFSMLIFAAASFLLKLPAVAEDVNADVLQAESLSNAGKNDQALTLLNHYLTTHPADARALVDRADVYQNEGKWSESITDYSAALAVNPQYAYAYASRAESYYHLDNDSRAMQDATKAIELKPKYAYPMRVRGLARLDSGDVAGAQSDFHAALVLEPESATTYAYACRADRAAKAMALAQQECAKALQIDPNNYDAQFQNGRLELDAGAYKDAEATYTTILKANNNDDPAASYWRALARFELHENDDALTDVNAYMRAYPDDGDGFFLRAQIEQSRGDVSAAKKDATSAAEHYGIDNDTDGMARAKALLEQLNNPKP